MNRPEIVLDREPADDDRISLLGWGTVVLRRRRLIIVLAFLGGVAGLLSGLLSHRLYKTNVTFLPQGSAESVSGLQLAASQLGVDLSKGGSDWFPSTYVELLRSNALLEPIVDDTVVVPEEDGARLAIVDLVKAKGSTPAIRRARGVDKLRRIVRVGEDRTIRAVRIEVVTRWPSVSLYLAERLVSGVNQFNLESRKSQAAAERQFVSDQTREAEGTLRAAEDSLQVFLQRNRVAGSPELAFQQDRLERQVTLKQQLYETLAHQLEEVRIREVRNTPVITMLETPRLPVIGEARGSALRGILGGLAGAALGVMIAFAAGSAAAARRAPSDEAREFFALVDETTPRFLRRWLPR